MKYKKTFLSIFILLFLVALTIVLWEPTLKILDSIESISIFIKEFGVFSVGAYILIFIIQIVLAPIPGQIVGTAGGYIFGFWLGLLCSIIGLIIGSLIVFYLSRKFGRPFVQKFVKKEHLEKYDKKIKENGAFILFLIYFIPFLPDDLVSFVAGLTKIKIRTLILISVIGRLPSFIMFSLIGSQLNQKNVELSAIILAGAIVISIVIYLKKDFLENKAMNLITKFRMIK